MLNELEAYHEDGSLPNGAPFASSVAAILGNAARSRGVASSSPSPSPSNDNPTLLTLGFDEGSYCDVVRALRAQIQRLLAVASSALLFGEIPFTITTEEIFAVATTLRGPSSQGTSFTHYRQTLLFLVLCETRSRV